MSDTKTAPFGTRGAVLRAPAVKPLMSLWEWQTDAACRGKDDADFFSPTGENDAARIVREARARKICDSCPVRVQCGAFALTTRQPYGIWGGITERERFRGTASVRS